MINETIKKRLIKDRPMTSITLRVPAYLVSDLKVMAPELGFSGYQPLIRSYVSEGIRRDEEMLKFSPAKRLAELLKAKGVDASLVEAALREASEPMHASR